MFSCFTSENLVQIVTVLQFLSYIENTRLEPVMHENSVSMKDRNTSKFNTYPSSFIGHCNFQNNLCDLKYDWNATFQWATASGQTPTEDTGPSFDHTTFSNDGKR